MVFYFTETNRIKLMTIGDASCSQLLSRRVPEAFTKVTSLRYLSKNHTIVKSIQHRGKAASNQPKVPTCFFKNTEFTFR